MLFEVRYQFSFLYYIKKVENDLKNEKQWKNNIIF